MFGLIKLEIKRKLDLKISNLKVRLKESRFKNSNLTKV